MFDAKLTHAIYIKHEEDLEMLKAINPELNDISFDGIKNYVFVANWPENGKYAFMPRPDFQELFEDIADGPYMLIRLVRLK